MTNLIKAAQEFLEATEAYMDYRPSDESDSKLAWDAFIQYDQRYNKANAALTAALEEAKRGQWMPIETAPKNGGVMLWGEGRIGFGYYHDVPRLGSYGPWHWPFTHQPTHWQPQPNPPEGTKL